MPNGGPYAANTITVPTLQTMKLTLKLCNSPKMTEDKSGNGKEVGGEENEQLNLPRMLVPC